MSARILDVTVEQYHRDPCDSPSLSASMANILLSKSPLHAWTEHPRLGAKPDDDEVIEDDDTEAFTKGKVIHTLLLGKGSQVALIDADSFRTKAAREERDEAVALGKVPMLRHKFDELAAAAAHLQDNCRALGYEFGGQSELAIEWSDAGVNGPVLCRSLLDHVYVDEGVIYDVKTIRNANPRQAARYFVEHGYDLQFTAYTRALATLKPELAGRIEFTFLFLELDPPYAVVPARPDGALREVGQERWKRALQLWERCIAANDWPAYCNSVVTLEAPPWVITQELGSEW